VGTYVSEEDSASIFKIKVNRGRILSGYTARVQEDGLSYPQHRRKT
jgi:hypothetical protein